jgi:hypothetical protein
MVSEWFSSTMTMTWLMDVVVAAEQGPDADTLACATRLLAAPTGEDALEGPPVHAISTVAATAAITT